MSARLALQQLNATLQQSTHTQHQLGADKEIKKSIRKRRKQAKKGTAAAAQQRQQREQQQRSRLEFYRATQGTQKATQELMSKVGVCAGLGCCISCCSAACWHDGTPLQPPQRPGVLLSARVCPASLPTITHTPVSLC
jgi:hypothetical protein